MSSFPPLEALESIALPSQIEELGALAIANDPISLLLEAIEPEQRVSFGGGASGGAGAGGSFELPPPPPPPGIPFVAQCDVIVELHATYTLRESASCQLNFPPFGGDSYEATSSYQDVSRQYRLQAGDRILTETFSNEDSNPDGLEIYFTCVDHDIAATSTAYSSAHPYIAYANGRTQGIASRQSGRQMMLSTRSVSSASDPTVGNGTFTQESSLAGSLSLRFFDPVTGAARATPCNEPPPPPPTSPPDPPPTEDPMTCCSCRDIARIVAASAAIQTTVTTAQIAAATAAILGGTSAELAATVAAILAGLATGEATDMSGLALRLVEVISEFLGRAGGAEVDLSEVLQAIAEVRDLVSVEVSGEVDITPCHPPDPNRSTVTHVLDGRGLAGILSKLNAIQELTTLAKTTICEKEAVAALPESWAVRPGQRSQLVVVFAELGRNGKPIGSSRWSFAIPHYRGSAAAPPAISGYSRGQVMGTLILADNSQVVVNCQTQAEAERVLNQVRRLIQPQYVQNAHMKFTTRKGATIQPKTVKPVYAKYFSTGQKNMIPDWIVEF